MGDLLQSAFLSPAEPTAGGWILGVGPALPGRLGGAVGWCPKPFAGGTGGRPKAGGALSLSPAAMLPSSASMPPPPLLEFTSGRIAPSGRAGGW